MLWDKSNFNYDFNPIDYIIVYVFSLNCCIVKIVKRKIMKMWMWKLPTWVILLLRKTSENTRQADNAVWINKHKYIIIRIYTISNSNQAMPEFENMSYIQNSFFCSCPFISFIQQKYSIIIAFLSYYYIERVQQTSENFPCKVIIIFLLQAKFPFLAPP